MIFHILYLYLYIISFLVVKVLNKLKLIFNKKKKEEVVVVVDFVVVIVRL
jgi:hypothetical protein